MNELENIAATFGTSKPIYSVKVGQYGELEFILKNQYVPETTGDPVQELLADQWREDLNIHRGCFQKRVSIESAFSKMLETIREVVLGCSPLKNVKQSNLYRWLKNQSLNYGGPMGVSYIALYRYIVSNGIEKTRDSRNPHAMNVIAILELMKEKYEE